MAARRSLLAAPTTRVTRPCGQWIALNPVLPVVLPVLARSGT